jgi:hypothetical protein
MQRHARGDEIELGVAACLARIHHLKADASLAGGRKVAPALSDHGRGDIGEDEPSLRIAPEQMTAEKPGAAAKLEHARAVELWQEARKLVGDCALEPGMKLVACGTRAEACRNLCATP